MNLNLLIKIIVGAYFIAINVFGYIMTYFQHKNHQAKLVANKEKNTDEFEQLSMFTKKEELKPTTKEIKNWRLFFIGILGGSLGIYLSMFVYKEHLKSFFFMVFIPVFLSINLYLILGVFLNFFWSNLPY